MEGTPILIISATPLVTGVLSVNMIVLWLYKKRQERATEGRLREQICNGDQLTLDLMSPQSNRPLTHTSTQQSEGEGEFQNEDEKYRICGSTLILYKLHGILNVGIVR